MFYKEMMNGVKIPQLGLGVWRANDGEEATNAVKWALEAGYRAIDTAAIYRNERSVGAGIKQSGIPREDIFLTSKVWNEDQGYETTLAAFEATLTRLETDYLDLYLIHWPVTGKTLDTWRALEELYEEGKIRAIGVSNFSEKHLEYLLANCKIKPMINQVELHPELTQQSLRTFCQKEGILVEAWSPLGQGHLLDNKQIQSIAEKYQKSAAQVILRWDLQNDIVTIPKSVTKSRIIENLDVFDFELTKQDLELITGLNQDKHLGTDPDTIAVK